MKTKLKKYTVNRVDQVDRGANPGAHILIWKSEDGAELEVECLEQDAEDLWKKDYPREKRAELAQQGKAIPVLDDKGKVVNGRYPIDDEEDLRDAVQSIGRVAAGDRPKVEALIRRRAEALGVHKSDEIEKALGEAHATMLNDSKNGGGESVPDNQEAADRIAELEDQLSKAEEALTKSNEAREAEKDEITKRLDAEKEEAVKKAAAAEERIQKLEDAAATKEAVAKAATFTHLPIESDKFGPVLKEIGEKLSPEAAAEVDRVLAAANEGFAKSEIFKAKGEDDGGAGTGEAVDQLDGLAKAYQKEQATAGNKMSFAKAYAEVLDTEEGKALYAENHRSFVKSVGGER